MATDKKLTPEKNLSDFKAAYQSKKKLIERQKEDFLFRLGKQWDDDKYEELKRRGVEPVTDNRIQPNVALLTGLERQNRSDFKAFPEGEEDTVKAEIATALFKNSVKVSDFQYKSSEMFEDGITCGESYLELYLDNTYSLLNGKPCWKKLDYDCVFPEKGYKEYDYSDARYIFKFTKGISKDDLISMFPEKKKDIERVEAGSFDIGTFLGDEDKHTQKRDYGTKGDSASDKGDSGFDLIERYYKKWVEKVYVGDRQTGEIKESETPEKANDFVVEYQQGIAQEQAQYEQEQTAYMMGQAMYQVDPMNTPMPMEPMAPAPRDPERYTMIKRYVPEIWYYASVPGIKKELADEKAWFFPKWKSWPIIPYLSNFSTAPIEGDDRHLLIQGIVHGVKGSQRKHNSVETLQYLHLNGAANSGWLSEEDSWVDPKKVENFGATPGVNLEYKAGKPPPQRIFPMSLSTGHAQLSETSAESIKAQLGINADLLAVQEGSSQSGRAIALRQRQGLIMVQKMFDNLSRTKQLCGKMLLTQLGEMYDTETAKKVLGDSFLMKNFPPMMLVNEMTGQPEPMMDELGQPMKYDKELADLAIAEVLRGDLWQYDVAVGEAVASETMKMANSAELEALDAKRPGLIPFELLVEESQLSQSTKQRILKSVQQAQAAALPPQMGGQPGDVAA